MSFVNGSDMMDDIAVFDGRRLRRGPDITSASSHPELATGDFAIPPRRYASSSSMIRPVIYDRRRAMGGTLAMVVIVVLLLTVAFRSAASNAGDIETQGFARTCMQWHLAAGAVVSRLVQSTHDVDLVYVSNSIDRMRRARRNCELGEMAQACQDYHSVAAGAPGPGYAISNDLFPCARVVASSDD